MWRMYMFCCCSMSITYSCSVHSFTRGPLQHCVDTFTSCIHLMLQWLHQWQQQQQQQNDMVCLFIEVFLTYGCVFHICTRLTVRGHVYTKYWIKFPLKLKFMKYTINVVVRFLRAGDCSCRIHCSCLYRR